MKVLCETTGQFGLHHDGQSIEANRPAVIDMTEFFGARAAIGQIRTLGTLRDEATNKEWLQYWKESDGDRELAVESFLSAFGSVTKAPKKKASTPK